MSSLIVKTELGAYILLQTTQKNETIHIYPNNMVPWFSKVYLVVEKHPDAPQNHALTLSVVYTSRYCLLEEAESRPPPLPGQPPGAYKIALGQSVLQAT